MQALVCGGSEQVFACDGNADLIAGTQLCRKGLLTALGFQQGRMRAAIGKDQTIDAKLPVILFVTEITAIGPDSPPVLVGFV